MPVPSMAVATAPKTSPSEISRMRAPACADLTDEVDVAVTLEDADDEVLDVALERLGDVADVLGGAGVDVDRVGGLGPDGDLLHVGVGRVQQRALGTEREHRERVRLTVRGEVRALERVDGDVDLLAALADLLADEEHRGLVALAFADDDRAGDVDVVERRAHALDGGVVGRVLVALAHPAAGGQRCGLGDLEHLDDTGVAHASSLIVPATRTRRARFRPTALARAVRRSAHRTARFRQRPEVPLGGDEPCPLVRDVAARADRRANSLPCSLARNADTTSSFSAFARVQVEYTTKPPGRTRRAASSSRRTPSDREFDRSRRA